MALSPTPLLAGKSILEHQISHIERENTVNSGKRIYQTIWLTFAYLGRNLQSSQFDYWISISFKDFKRVRGFVTMKNCQLLLEVIDEKVMKK